MSAWKKSYFWNFFNDWSWEILHRGSFCLFFCVCLEIFIVKKLYFIINFIHILYFLFLLVGILRISDALYICGSCTNGTVTFSSRMDCYCLYFYLCYWESPWGMSLVFPTSNLVYIWRVLCFVLVMCVGMCYSYPHT